MILVFVSHSSKDDKFVNRLNKRLKKAGIKTWIDHNDIPDGARWRKEIETALKASTCGLLILSKMSSSSEEVDDEWEKILADDKELFVARIENLDEYSYKLRAIQQTDFTKNFDTASDKLIRSIRKTFSHLISSPISTTKVRMVINAPHNKRTKVLLVAVISLITGLKKNEIEIVYTQPGSVIAVIGLNQEAAYELVQSWRNRKPSVADFEFSSQLDIVDIKFDGPVKELILQVFREYPSTTFSEYELEAELSKARIEFNSTAREKLSKLEQQGFIHTNPDGTLTLKD